MEQIVKAAGPTETLYRDVSEDARGAGMEKTGWVRQQSDFRGTWAATRFYAGESPTEIFASRWDAERWIERTLENGTLVARITVH